MSKLLVQTFVTTLSLKYFTNLFFSASIILLNQKKFNMFCGWKDISIPIHAKEDT